MKSRRLVLTLEISTDLPLPLLKHLREIGIADSRGHLQRVTVLQSNPNVIREKKVKRLVRIHR